MHKGGCIVLLLCHFHSLRRQSTAKTGLWWQRLRARTCARQQQPQAPRGRHLRVTATRKEIILATCPTNNTPSPSLLLVQVLVRLCLSLSRLALVLKVISQSSLFLPLSQSLLPAANHYQAKPSIPTLPSRQLFPQPPHNDKDAPWPTTTVLSPV